MRRPPALLIVVAVMLTGVSVGWAASHDTDSEVTEPMQARGDFTLFWAGVYPENRR